MPETFELDATGLHTPRLLPDVRALVVEKWRGAFGANAQTASDSPDGLIIDVLSALLLLHWEAVTDVYQNSFFRTADGTSLGLLLDLFGKVRLPAAPATAPLVWYGTDTTLIPDGHIAATPSGSRFANDADATIGTDAYVIRIESLTDFETYGVAIGVNTYGHTSGSPADHVEIGEGLATELLADQDALYLGLDPLGRALVLVLNPSDPVLPDVGDVAVFNAVVAPSTCTADGPTVALAGTITEVSNPISGVEGVSSTEDAEGGREIETAAEFRARHLDTLNDPGNGSNEAIRAHVLALDDVEQVIAISNRTDVTDSGGRPPHSVEAIVLGGDDDEIAATLFASVSAGDQTYGNTTVEVTDSEGGTTEISFSRPTVLYLHLSIVVTPGEGYPTVGTPLTTIRDAVVAYLTTGTTKLRMGQDLFRFQLGVPIGSAVPGIASVVIEADVTPAPLDAPTLVASDIAVGEREILDVDSSRVVVA